MLGCYVTAIFFTHMKSLKQFECSEATCRGRFTKNKITNFYKAEDGGAGSSKS